MALVLRANYTKWEMSAPLPSADLLISTGNESAGLRTRMTGVPHHGYIYRGVEYRENV